MKRKMVVIILISILLVISLALITSSLNKIDINKLSGDLVLRYPRLGNDGVIVYSLSSDKQTNFVEESVFCDPIYNQNKSKILSVDYGGSIFEYDLNSKKITTYIHQILEKLALCQDIYLIKVKLALLKMKIYSY